MRNNRVFPAVFAVFGLALTASAGCTKEPTPAPAPAAAPAPATPPRRPPSRRCASAYSDWPGWVAWEIGIQKGWFKEAGVDVEFDWFEYAAVDGGVRRRQGRRRDDDQRRRAGDRRDRRAAASIILITDYSNGNDMIVAKPGIKQHQGPQGQEDRRRVGLVEHLLLLKALEKNGMKKTDVEIVNVPTNRRRRRWPRARSTRSRAWQPNAGQALKEVPGSKAIFTSADVPGLIYDLVARQPEEPGRSARADWAKVVKVWYRIADFVRDPKTHDEAVEDHGGRASASTPEEYAQLPCRARTSCRSRRRRSASSQGRRPRTRCYGIEQDRRRVQRRQQGLRRSRSPSRTTSTRVARPGGARQVARQQ